MKRRAVGAAPAGGICPLPPIASRSKEGRALLQGADFGDERPMNPIAVEEVSDEARPSSRAPCQREPFMQEDGVSAAWRRIDGMGESGAAGFFFC